MLSLRDRSRRNYKFSFAICLVFMIIIFQYYLYCKYRDEFHSLLCPYSFKIMDKRIVFDHQSYSIHHYPEFVCPQNFRNMADWVYGWPEGVFEERVENSVRKIRETIEYLPHGSILYIKTDRLPTFFSDIYPHFRNKFVLITAQGDAQAPGPHLHYLERTDSKIIHWFAQNGDINASRSERFTHIPIGKYRVFFLN